MDHSTAFAYGSPGGGKEPKPEPAPAPDPAPEPAPE